MKTPFMPLAETIFISLTLTIIGIYYVALTQQSQISFTAYGLSLIIFSHCTKDIATISTTITTFDNIDYDNTYKMRLYQYMSHISIFLQCHNLRFFFTLKAKDSICITNQHNDYPITISFLFSRRR